MPEGSRSEFETAIGVGSGLCGLPRTDLLGTWVNRRSGWLRSARLCGHGSSPLAHRALRLSGRILRGDAGEYGRAAARRDHPIGLGRSRPAGPPGRGGRHRVRHPRGGDRGPDRLLGGPRRRQAVRPQVGAPRPDHARAPGACRGVLRSPRGQGGLPGPLLRGVEGVRGAGGWDQRDALEDLRLLQRPGGAVWATAVVLVGYFLGSSLGLVERWLGRATLLLGSLVAVVVCFYLAYRWVASNRARLVGYGEAALSYPPVARMRERYDAQLRWLLRRLTPGQYLGLHLTLGLALAAGCLWLFGGLAEDVVTGDPLVRYDKAIDVYLHSAATPPLTTFFLVITAFGSIETVALIGVVVAAFFAWRRRWLHLATWIAAVAGGAVLNHLLKGLFARPRPFFEHPLLIETSYSFPSGHAMESFVLYGMLAYFAVIALKTWRARVAVVFAF